MNLPPQNQPQRSIQSFGVLVCLDEALLYVQQVSANIAHILGLRAEECVGAPASQVLGKNLIARLRRTMRNTEKARSVLSASRKTGGVRQSLHVTAYRSGESVVVELEPLGPSSKRRWLSVVNEWLEHIVSTQTPQELLNTLAQSIRALTRYDRVLVHSFDSEGNSTVLAECQAPNMSSYLGYRFPPSHVPPETRAAYHYNRIRIIEDVSAPEVPLVAAANASQAHEPHNGEPSVLDLRLGILRASTQIKMENLLGAHVGASLTIAIFNEQTLWGRVVCHSEEPRTLAPSAREAAATLTQVAAQRLFLLNAQASARYRAKVEESRVWLHEGIQQRVAPADLLHQRAEQWLRLFDACGIALIYRNEISHEGETLSREDLRALALWLNTRVRDPLPWATCALTEAGFEPDAETACRGLLAMPLIIDMASRGWLLLFRTECHEEIDWAGLPGDVKPGMRDVRQKESFVTWREQVTGHSTEWRPIELSAVQDLGEDFAVIVAAQEIVRLNESLEKEQEALAQANQHLQQMAQTDALTGASSRARTEELIDDAFDLARRYQQVFSVLLLDIDHFKSINDTFGHNVGDQVLKTLVDCLRHDLRKSDHLGRWGGEEFVLLLRNTPVDQARALAERMRQSVHNTAFHIERPVTISVGVAEWRESDTREVLLERADDAMYDAKESGRDRVVVAR